MTETSGVASPKEPTKSSKIEVQVALPEAFKDNSGGLIEDVASNGSYTFVLRRSSPSGKSYLPVIYNHLGQEVTPPKRIFPVKLKELYETVKENQKGSSSPGFSLNKNHTVYFGNFLGKWPDSAFEKARASLQKMAGSNTYIYIPQNFKSEERYLLYPDQKTRIKTALNGEYFVVETAGEEVSLVKTKEGDTVLSPDKWEIQNFMTKSILKESESKLPPGLDDDLLIFNDRVIDVPGKSIALLFEESGALSVFDTAKKRNLFSTGTRDFSLDPSDSNTLVYINPDKDDEITSVEVLKIASRRWSLQSKKLKDIQGKVTKIQHDPQGNFLVVLSEKENTGWISIHDKDTLEKVYEIPEARRNLEVDITGNILFSDHNNRIRMASTNFNSFPKGMGDMEKKKERLKELRKTLGEIKEEDLQKILEESERIIPSGELSPDEEAIKLVEAKLGELFNKKITAAKGDLVALAKINGQIEHLKSDPRFEKYPEAFESFEARIGGMVNGLKLEQLKKLLNEAKNAQKELSSFEDALSLEERLKELISIRQSISINKEEKGQIDKLIASLTKSSEENLDKHQKEFLGKVDEQFGTVEGLISTAGSAEELADLKVSPELATLERWLGNIRDTAKQRELRARLRGLFEKRSESLHSELAKFEEETRFQSAQNIEDIQIATEELAGLIDASVGSAKDFDTWVKRNPHIQRIRGKILGLPDNLREEQGKALDDFLSAKKHDVEYKRKLEIKPGEKVQTVTFGKVTFPVYIAPKIVWQPKVDPLSAASKYGHLKFVDNTGREWSPDLGSVPTDLSDITTKGAVDLYSPEAATFFNSIKRRVPDFDQKWVLSDFSSEKLEEMARLLNIQEAQQKGALILEGEAGTGKNVLLEVFSHFTNREFFNFACNLQTEEEDITFAFRFDPTRGTYQVDSRVIEALKTPGAIINFDEINTLPTGVAKMLNPLLDHRRTLFFPEGRKEQKAHPSVLISGTMNPQHYLGVKPLSPELKSRARIMIVEYPPEKDGKGKLSDEAMIYAKYLPSLETFTPEEFTKVWDYVVNKEKDNGGDKFTNNQVEKDIKDISQLVAIANNVRDAYEKFRTGKSTDVIEFVFSIREGIDVVSQLGAFPNVKESIKDVVLPKISNSQEREMVEALIDQT